MMRLLMFLLYRWTRASMLKIVDEMLLQLHRQLRTRVRTIHCWLPSLRLQLLERDNHWMPRHSSWGVRRKTDLCLCSSMGQHVCCSVFGCVFGCSLFLIGAVDWPTWEKGQKLVFTHRLASFLLSLSLSLPPVPSEKQLYTRSQKEIYLVQLVIQSTSIANALAVAISTPQRRGARITIGTMNACFLHCRLETEGKHHWIANEFVELCYSRDAVWAWSMDDCVRSFYDRDHKHCINNFHFHHVSIMALLLLRN